MTRAVVLALVAAVVAAAALVELAGAGVGARRGPGPGRSRARAPRRARAAAGLARLGRRLGVPAAPGDLGRRLEAAGMAPGVSAAEVMAVKVGAALLAFVVALAPSAALPGRLGAVALAAAPAGAFLAPDAWLARRTGRRRAEMAAELADVLDLVHVAVAAGMAPLRALGEVGGRRGGPLAAELRAAATRAALGVPRAEVLEGVARRCPLEEVAALVAAIGRAERHGAPLTPSLRAIAVDARAHRAQRLRERAARAAPQIQLVVALLLVPAVMLIVGACLAAGFL
ncbi:MAG: tight adherence protein [Solirubrobacteraceae bacterium]|nr:tight adherence protein [Solirubrobacteraceae bacterium]